MQRALLAMGGFRSISCLARNSSSDVFAIISMITGSVFQKNLYPLYHKNFF